MKSGNQQIQGNTKYIKHSWNEFYSYIKENQKCNRRYRPEGVKMAN
jgi:hypothetical protein